MLPEASEQKKLNNELRTRSLLDGKDVVNKIFDPFVSLQCRSKEVEDDSKHICKTQGTKTTFARTRSDAKRT